MNSQAGAKSGKNSVATLNVHDTWLRMLHDEEPPKSSWRPRKSTKSWDQLSVRKFTKVTQSRKQVHRVGKLVLPSLVAWRACTKIRDAPAEKRRESKVQRSSTRTEMLFLWCFSAQYWEIILAASGAHCTILAILCFLLLRSTGKVQNWVRRRSYYLKLCEAHGLNTWGQLPHLIKHGRKFSNMWRTSCSSLSRVFYRLVLHALLHLRLLHRCRRTMKILLCVQQHHEVRIWVNKHKETCYKPSHRTTNKHGGDPLPLELPWGKV